MIENNSEQERKDIEGGDSVETQKLCKVLEG